MFQNANIFKLCACRSLGEIEDDGKGFDIENLDVISRNDNSGFGLSMMKERVYLLSGEIEITSEENVGTKVKVRVPINNKEEK